jgi:cytoskeleton protein RodZ
MSAPAGDASRVGIGARLRAGRERSGLTLLQAAEKLHVDSKVLEALESEKFESLGAPVFARGHLRRYAELIGEQATQLQGLYNENTRPPPLPDLTRAPRVPRRPDSQRLVAPGVAGLIAIALAGGVWIVLQVLNGDEPQSRTAELVVPPTVAPGNAESVPGAEAVPGAPPGPDAQPGPGLEISRGARPLQGAPPSQAGRDPQAARQSRTAPPAVAGPTKEAGQSAPKSAEQAAPARKPRTVSVTLKFAADSWVEVYDVNGERLFYDIGSADSVRSVTGTPPLRVVLGNAPAVALEVDGRAAQVPASAMQDEAAQFTINRAGRIAK